MIGGGGGGVGGGGGGGGGVNGLGYTSLYCITIPIKRVLYSSTESVFAPSLPSISRITAP